MSNTKKARSAAPRLVSEAAFIVGVVLCVLLLLVALFGLALHFAGGLGFQLYTVNAANVPSLLPDGALIRIDSVPQARVSQGDLIAFEANDSLGVLRVQENLTQEARFTADGPPGDENVYSIPYAALLGQVTAQLPVLGLLAGNPPIPPSSPCAR